MNITYAETRSCCLYHFKVKVLMNLESYSKCFGKDNDNKMFVKVDYRMVLKELICKDVKEIFDKYIPIGSDYQHDWKLIDYHYLLRDMMREHLKVSP